MDRRRRPVTQGKTQRHQLLSHQNQVIRPRRKVNCTIPFKISKTPKISKSKSSKNFKNSTKSTNNSSTQMKTPTLSVQPSPTKTNFKLSQICEPNSCQTILTTQYFQINPKGKISMNMSLKSNWKKCRNGKKESKPLTIMSM
jgi:hypothetical protein